MVSARSTMFVLTLAACAEMPTEGIARGEVLYQNCEQCHGAQGEGSTLSHAPPLAAMPAWYIESQVLHFQSGWRGAHPDDVEGLKMRAMSRTIKTDADVKVVAEYVSKLPKVVTVTTLTGDAALGKAAFAVCAGCHGADGAGIEAQQAPPLHNLPDWYIVRQIAKYKTGVRGYEVQDVPANQMKAIAALVADAAAAKDLAAYIQTL